jgi:deazaflavin-dependent oxidoreductase (nitroreductase family)
VDRPAGQTLGDPAPRPREPGAPASRYAEMIRRVARRPWFAAIGRRMAPVDRVLYRLSGGRVTILGLQGRAMPETCLLTTRGRRSGKARTTPVMFLREGEGIVVTSESFGQSRPAAWPLNLDSDPSAEVTIGGRTREYRARRATDAEIETLWPRFVELWPAHASYRERSGVLKMFVLEPLR